MSILKKATFCKASHPWEIILTMAKKCPILVNFHHKKDSEIYLLTWSSKASIHSEDVVSNGVHDLSTNKLPNSKILIKIRICLLTLINTLRNLNILVICNSIPGLLRALIYYYRLEVSLQLIHPHRSRIWSLA